ncbi:MAG: AmmeMemoRadiSam system protein B [Porticoccus sp.]|nr:AmmeMemoRadiSam system protein B [Porticoccus sp.]
MLSREPAVAGMFYPDNPKTLQEQVDSFLSTTNEPTLIPKALIVPHAGYIYSGAIAASAYQLLKPIAHRLSRVVLLGPSHHVPLSGLAAPSATTFCTPLGDIPVDQNGIAALLKLSLINIKDEAHQFEHSLEVQLPFLQRIMNDFQLLPLVVGNAKPDQVAEVLRCAWGGDETLVVISSDLSHYHPYQEAQRLDQETTAMIEQLDGRITGSQACGCNAINGLLRLANNERMSIKTIDLKNSWDAITSSYTNGSSVTKNTENRDRVVGYGAYAIY